MGEIRALERADLQEVADLLVRVFQKRDATASAEMRDYLGTISLDLPDRHPDITCLVYAGSDGAILGFLGAYTQRMQLGDQQLIAAIGHSLAVSPDLSDPTAGARLCRRLFQGAQDLTISDRANPVSTGLWRSLGGDVLPFYSLDWRRVLRPVEAASHRLRRRLGLLRPSLPLARTGDRLLAQLAASRGQPLLPQPELPLKPRGMHRRDADRGGMMEALRALAGEDALHPIWSDAGLELQLDHALQKKDFGEPVQQVVTDAGGRFAGAYIYHLAPMGEAAVLQVFSRRALAGQVLDHLLVDALERGAVAIGGRAQPRLIEPLMERGAVFSSVARCVFTARDPLVLKAAREGDAMLGGLVGEAWPRLHGDRLQ
ncbi:hypothetical protein SAMN05216456_2808 [Devosia crocina]|uniref:Uncharacterized protein n=1 Tax=Devosia crocina TaxID=429728 RepID=A0A1I7NRJ0_9HYPH|nr:hypothetical protein [Devosia crocina]SFV37212.1 hypothetical protein SAMN05216456_2808 [Devosia crocina]